MNDRTFSPILFCLIFLFLNTVDLKANYYHPYLLDNNVEEVRADIISFYENTYGGTEQSSFTELLDNFLQDLNLGTTSLEGCERGYLTTTGYYEFNENFRTQSLLQMRWIEASEHCESFYHAYIDLTTLQKWDTTTITPGIAYRFSGTTQYKLLAMNARCAEAQSPYFIIIVDRDLDLSDLNNVSQIRSEYISALAAKASEVQLFPNPVSKHKAYTTIDINHSHSGFVSLFLIEAQSGILRKTILQEEILEKGRHQLLFNTQGLASGFYYLILQSPEERIVQSFLVY